jgi:hypothetical protein
MIIYTNLYKTYTRNYNVISDHFGLEHIEPLSYEDFCSSITPEAPDIIIPSLLLGRSRSEETKALIGAKNRGRKRTDEFKKRISELAKLRSSESYKKQSATVTGRRKFVKPDGSWTWIYPTKT